MIKDELKFFRLQSSSTKDNTSKYNVVIYTRVSSKEQTLTDSLSNQLNVCNNYCINKGFHVLKYFGGKYESAKHDTLRKEFTNMIDFVCNPKNKINAIVVYSHDRFSRTGLGGAFEILGKLKRLGIKVYSAMFDIDPDSLEGQVMLTMSMMQASVENQSKSNLTKQRILAKIENGIWCSNTPRGYERDKNKNIILNKDSIYIKEAFEIFKNGGKISEVKRKLDSKGYHLCIKRWYEVLHNPFYCGVIVTKTNNYVPIKGIHPALISIEDFKKCQFQKENTGKFTTVKNYAKLTFKSFLFCDCGSQLTGYKTKKYYYYKSNCPSCTINISAIKIYSIFENHINLNTNKSVSRIDFEKNLISNIAKHQKNITLKVEEIENNIKILKDKKQKLIDLLIDKQVEVSYVNQNIEQIEQEISDFLSQINNMPNKLSNSTFTAKKISFFYYNILNMWNIENELLKRRLQKIVLTDRILIEYKNGNYRTIFNSIFFELMSSFCESYDNKKADNSNLNLNMSAYVPRIGIEPILFRNTSLSRARLPVPPPGQLFHKGKGKF